MGDMKIIGKGAFYTFIGLIISKIITYLWRIVIARIGPEEYGLVSLALVVFGIAYSLSILGLEAGIARYLAYFQGKNDLQRMKGVITSTVKLTVPVSLIVSAIIFIYSGFISEFIFKTPALSPLLKIISFAIFPYLLYNISLSALTGLKKIEHTVFLRQIIEGLVKLAATILLLYLGYGVFGVVIAYVITYVIVALFSWHYLEKAFPILTNKISAITMKKELLKYSLPLLFGGIVSQILSWTDLIMIGYFRSASEIGVYNTALPTAGLMLVFPATLGALFLPTIAMNYAKGLTKNMESLYIKVTKIVIAANIPVLLITVFFSEEILGFLFGSAYIEGGWALKLLTIGFFFYASATTSNSMLDVFKKTKLLMAISILSAATNAMLNYILIPIYGINGAAASSAFALVLSTFLSMSYTYREIKAFPLNRSIIYLLFFGMLSISIVYLGLHTMYPIIPTLPAVVGVGVFLLIYAYLIFRFSIVSMAEIRQIVEILNKKYMKR